MPSTLTRIWLFSSSTRRLAKQEKTYLPFNREEEVTLNASRKPETLGRLPAAISVDQRGGSSWYWDGGSGPRQPTGAPGQVLLDRIARKRRQRLSEKGHELWNRRWIRKRRSGKGQMRRIGRKY